MNNIVFVSLILVIAHVHAFDATSEPIKYMVTHEAWFDIAVVQYRGSHEYLTRGRVLIGLFGDICPMTVNNFVQLTKGFKRDKVK